MADDALTAACVADNGAGGPRCLGCAGCPSTVTDDALTAAVTEVLAAHSFKVYDHRMPRKVGCTCGLIQPDDNNRERQAAHVAEQVAQVVREQTAATQAEALREAADEANGVGHHWSGAPALAFFALSGDLRDRAERLHPEPAPDGGA